MFIIDDIISLILIFHEFNNRYLNRLKIDNKKSNTNEWQISNENNPLYDDSLLFYIHGGYLSQCIVCKFKHEYCYCEWGDPFFLDEELKGFSKTFAWELERLSKQYLENDYSEKKVKDFIRKIYKQEWSKHKKHH